MAGVSAVRWILVAVVLLTMLRPALAQSLEGAGPIFSLAIDPVTPTTLYIGAQGVWKSINGGATWNITGLTDREQYSLAIDPVTPTTLYAGRGGAIARSTNAGMSWTSVAVVGDVYGLLIDSGSPATLYAQVSTNSGWTVLKSTDGGLSWFETAPPVHLTINGLAMDASRPTNLYATASDPRVAGADCCIVFRSTDGGASWIERGTVTANLLPRQKGPVRPGRRTACRGLSP